jgi:NDP-sugar pyrophosphorylase family protein
MQVVILAGGLGTRMRTIAPEVPKCLIEVAGRPFADLQLSWLSSQGVSRVLYSIGYLGDQVRAYVGDGSSWNLDVRYVDDGSDPRGTAGALRLGLDLNLLEDRFFVLYGDSYLTVSLDEVANAYQLRGVPALMTVFRNEGRWEESNVAFDGVLVTRYEKHSASSTPEKSFVDYGLSALSATVVQEIPVGAQSDLATLFGALSAEGRLGGFEVHDRFYEIGSPEGLRDLEGRLQRAV